MRVVFYFLDLKFKTTKLTPALSVRSITLDKNSVTQDNFGYIRNEAAYWLEGEIAIEKMQKKFGQYYTFEIHQKEALKRETQFKFQYTTELTGSKIHSFTLPVTQKKLYWRHLANNIEKEGNITSWSAQLIQEQVIVTEENSFMWSK